MHQFFLVSTELRDPYEPRACHTITRLRSELRDDMALVEVLPPLPRHVYDTAEELGQLILAPRFAGDTLFPTASRPVPVYVCRLNEKAAIQGDTIRASDLTILDWGEVRRTP